MQTTHAVELIAKVRENLCRVIIGKQKQIDYVLAALISGGHLLLEDIPGVGKTTLVKALAASVGGKVSRIQFTPDLLPTDIVGGSIYNQKDGQFHFNPGPLFANVILADEINRASPRTQSALLEAMGEKQISIDGKSIRLEPPFVVIATQNPVDSHGTYPLPEAQLDRFCMQLSLGYPTTSELKSIMLGDGGTAKLDELTPAMSLEELLLIQALANKVEIENSVADYLLALVDATRSHQAVKFGVSPRGAIAFLATVRALAFMNGRLYVLPDDLKKLAVPVLAHRLVLDMKSKYAGIHKDTVITEILSTVRVPR
ncbi:MAG: MoxR family ATPase [Acidobacteria bacterium]|nr:MoxR family ATPase [Acidobacteriota bacterium]